MTPEEQRAYDEWLERARPFLEEKRWTEAMKDVPTLHVEPARPRPLSKPLDQCRVALVTSGGISAPGQPPMDGPNIEGDYTIRAIDRDEPMEGIQIWHTHYDTAAASEDRNVVYPMDRLKELAAEGVI
ncbi:MAG: hypothetical protein IT307_17850, partial [Chloroflexi bacterium]|nr:hypothetical protein [Chloroflexota bacterium]